MDLGLKGRVAMLTGASQGIARASAYILASEGSSVSICARHIGPLEEVAADIEAKTGSKALAVEADMTKLDDIQRFTKRTVEQFGRIDILVNSAGASSLGDVLDTSDEEWQADMDLKFLGYVRAAREVAPIMIHQRSGVIISIIGCGGKMVYPQHVAGGAGNAALMLFTAGFASEIGKHNVRVLGINPGPVNTGRWRRGLPIWAKYMSTSEEAANQWFVDQTPIGRTCQPEDIANLVAFLSSDRSYMINGTTVTIDGGMCRSIV